MSTRRIEIQTMTAKNCRTNPPRMTMAALQDTNGRFKIMPKGIKSGGWAEFANAIEPGDVLLYRKTGFKDPFLPTSKVEIMPDEPTYSAPAPAPAPLAGPSAEFESARSMREAIADKTKLNAAEMKIELAHSQFLEFKLRLDALYEKSVSQAAAIETLQSRVEELEAQLEEVLGELEESVDVTDLETAQALQGATNPTVMIGQALGAALPDLLQLGKEFIEARKTESQNRQLELMQRMGFKPADAQPQQGGSGQMNQGY